MSQITVEKACITCEYVHDRAAIYPERPKCLHPLRGGGRTGKTTQLGASCDFWTKIVDRCNVQE
jgi:hypothetical protein